MKASWLQWVLNTHTWGRRQSSECGFNIFSFLCTFAFCVMFKICVVSSAKREWNYLYQFKYLNRNCVRYKVNQSITYLSHDIQGTTPVKCSPVSFFNFYTVICFAFYIFGWCFMIVNVFWWLRKFMVSGGWVIWLKFWVVVLQIKSTTDSSMSTLMS